MTRTVTLIRWDKVIKDSYKWQKDKYGNEDDRGCQRTPPASAEAEASDAKRMEDRDDYDDEHDYYWEKDDGKDDGKDDDIEDSDNDNGDQDDDDNHKDDGKDDDIEDSDNDNVIRMMVIKMMMTMVI